MWISMFDFSKDFLKFKDYLLSNGSSKWGTIQVITGNTSQVSFAIKNKLFAFQIKPRFNLREIDVMFFEVKNGQVNHGGRYYWDDSNFKPHNIAFFRSILQTFFSWLVSIGYDGLICFSRRNFDVIETLYPVQLGVDKYLAVGVQSAHILSLLSKLPLSSTYQGGKEKACLEQRVFYDATMLVNWSFYPNPGITFTHAPHELFQMEDLEDYYILARCTTSEELDDFLVYLQQCDAHGREINDELKTKLASISPDISTRGFRVEPNMDNFRLRYKVHAFSYEAYFDTKEEAMGVCAFHFDTYARGELAKQKLTTLLKSHDSSAVIGDRHITFLGHRLTFDVSSKIEVGKQILSYRFNADTHIDFEDDKALFLDAQQKITEFAKKHRLLSMFK